jgi:hypothetical protein
MKTKKSKSSNLIKRPQNIIEKSLQLPAVRGDTKDKRSKLSSCSLPGFQKTLLEFTSIGIEFVNLADATFPFSETSLIEKNQ